MSDFHVAIGDIVSFSKTVGESDVYGFAGITGDFANVHVNDQYMKGSAYGQRIAHGVLLMGYMSTTSSMMIDKSGSESSDETAVSLGYDRVRFIAPVFIGDTVTVTYQIKDTDTERRRSRSDVTAINQHGDTVAVAEHIMKWVKDA
ncbi:MAG: MaoC/PaaZ C-terminal domain-containing protein [Alphaproteobacteria bacterium]|jgi:acyl dehydratase|nr:MaoC/PaaZ C-terminal domain-containing protein [Alphaproteobacteria bacterium]MDP7172782.1 MaoC/PaaZ C-terminal domain-containing protein [Alphaproteobacteria bacterium]MDP7233123.1 MaoC/PaaZ C-terminal domain-containing protein [Alphaproteobacteria bacterium]MDP7488443.1 MaoC/PaaZ C-terminal domain-containing protein [Alphaproteobacteria bacterium]HJN20747.1 MaoC/PaaZ C-terminal domain-containing protein [Alphaproteobacteria bacterium]|tara:strand:+ start:859 stop:1296 length:438 start_codon:yes stop_codon:yes gene_type:complete